MPQLAKTNVSLSGRANSIAMTSSETAALLYANTHRSTVSADCSLTAAFPGIPVVK
jgi:hypothetical protein